MSKIEPSKYQKNIYDFIVRGVGNAVVEAVAGSGKTTTLISGLGFIPRKLNVIFFAFNKHIEKELKKKIPKGAHNVEVSTIHSYGFSALKKYRETELKDTKYQELIEKITKYSEQYDIKLLNKYNFDKNTIKMIHEFIFTGAEKEKIRDASDYYKRVKKLTDLGRLNLIDTKNIINANSQLKELAEKHGITTNLGECYRAWLLINIGASYLSEVDFNDMVFLPNHFNLDTKKYDMVFIDECQDLNACQRELMQKAIKPKTGRFIAVGDPAQAIYGFGGADSDSFSKIKDIPNTIVLPLSVCYRCGSKIVNMAKELVPSIEVAPNAPIGLIEPKFSYKNVIEGDMVLCRNTMPLVSLCMKYLSQGVKAYVMGRDISTSLIKMVKSCERKTEDFSCENVFARIYRDRNKLIEDIMYKEKCTREKAEQNQLAASSLDKIQTLESLAAGCITGNDLIEKITKIFSNDSDGICLSTIHKSKGLEADRVFIIHNELMPSKYAIEDWEIEQEQNLIYVAYTRAKSVLGFITDFDAYSNHKSKEYLNATIKDSEFVGFVGQKVELRLKVVLVKEMLTPYGEVPLYEMVDDSGNLFSKFGYIPGKHLISNDGEVKENSIVIFKSTIKAHKTYNGIKTNVISYISKI